MAFPFVWHSILSDIRNKIVRHDYYSSIETMVDDWYYHLVLTNPVQRAMSKEQEHEKKQEQEQKQEQEYEQVLT